VHRVPQRLRPGGLDGAVVVIRLEEPVVEAVEGALLEVGVCWLLAKEGRFVDSELEKVSNYMNIFSSHAFVIIASY